MAHAKLIHSTAAVVLAMAACGGPPPMEPEVPSDVTTTSTKVSVSPPVEPEPSVELHPAASERAPATVANPKAVPLSDADILGIVEAEGIGERREARDAGKVSQSARVREFAHLVLTDHADGWLTHVEDVTALSPAESSTAAAMRTSQARLDDALLAAAPRRFDRAYLDGQIQQMTDFIGMLDATLLPQAQNDHVRHLLEELRASTGKHLAMATDLRRSIGAE